MFSKPPKSALAWFHAGHAWLRWRLVRGGDPCPILIVIPSRFMARRKVGISGIELDTGLGGAVEGRGRVPAALKEWRVVRDEAQRDQLL